MSDFAGKAQGQGRIYPRDESFNQNLFFHCLDCLLKTSKYSLWRPDAVIRPARIGPFWKMYNQDRDPVGKSRMIP